MTCLRTAAPNQLLTLRLDRCCRSSNYSRRREVLPLTFLSTDFNKELMSAQDPPVIVSHPDLAGLTRILSSVFFVDSLIVMAKLSSGEIFLGAGVWKISTDSITV